MLYIKPNKNTLLFMEMVVVTYLLRPFD